MLPGCSGGEWVVDDFSDCFRTAYLQTVFPAIACAVSLFLLIAQIWRRVDHARSKYDYEALGANGHSVSSRRPSIQTQPTSGPAEEQDSNDTAFSTIVQAPEAVTGHHVSLQRTSSRTDGSIVEMDKARAEVSLVTVEMVAAAAQVFIHLILLAPLLTRTEGEFGAAVTNLVTWTYVFGLVTVRLVSSMRPRYLIVGLWYHTACLYGFEWLLATLVLRHAFLVESGFGLYQALYVARFAFATLVFGIALTTRKGNKSIMVEHDKGLEPSPEPLASLLSRFTFSWVDPLVWKGYQSNLKMPDIWDLPKKDRAAWILEDFRQVKKTSALAWRLFGYFRSTFLLQGAWAAVASIFTFAPTLLLKPILEYVEQPNESPRSAAWLYVILLFVTGCITSLCDGQALWLGRRICVRLHAIIVGEIYAKTLRRKVASATDTVLGGEDVHGGKDDGGSKRSLMSRILPFGRRRKRGAEGKQKNKRSTATQVPGSDSDASDKEGDSDSQANIGTIINLMAVDSLKLAEVSAYLHFLWAAVPIEIAVSVGLLYGLLGLSSIAGIGVMLILLPVNLMIARGFSIFQKRIMAATDARIHITNEVLQNIRIIKFFAWEHRFGRLVDEKRAIELRHLRNRYLLWSAAATIFWGSPLIIAFLTFFVYTVIEKKDLVPSVAFTALSLFNILRVPLDQLADMIAHVQESKVSVDRIEEFLDEDETEKYTQLDETLHDEHNEAMIGFREATCTWGSRRAAKRGEGTAFALRDLDLTFRVGQLNVVTGPTGSGKTSLLMALLGEMALLQGQISLPGAFSREDLAPDRETGLMECVAYCAQQAWLVNGTIKQNILFASPVDEKRYNAVLRACALERDLEILPAGDQTPVGEKGISLSGGQKQRISLARALYSKTRHVLLDDCLSAVDSHTAKWIFEHCIMGPLMYSRTCILVTHNVALCVPRAQFVVCLENGAVVAQGSPQEIKSSGILGDDLQKSTAGSTSSSAPQSRPQSAILRVEDLAEAALPDGHANGSENGVLSGKAPKPTDFNEAGSGVIHEEEVAVGRIKWPIIKIYLVAMGAWYYWVAAAAIFAVEQVSYVSSNVWVREWANSYQSVQLFSLDLASGVSALIFPNKYRSLGLPSCVASGSCPWTMPTRLSSAQTTSSTDMSEGRRPDLRYYLSVYAALVFGFMLLCAIRELTLFWGSLTASRRLHRRLLEAVTRAKFTFFDSTPLGQLMNRFSKDIEAIDQQIAPTALSVLCCLASVITIVVLISIITPGFLVAAIVITAVYYLIGMFYIRSSRDLKRLEAVQRSPIYQQFGETLNGVTTIRAYGDERRFIRENMQRVNNHHRPFLYLWSTNRWLAFRVDVVGAMVSFFAGCFVIINVGKIDPGAAGLSLTYAVTFTENVLWLVRLYSVNEQNMNSVERIQQYMQVPQEATAIVPENRPPSNWPSEGAVQFVDYSTRYRSDLDPVLSHIDLEIRPLEKVGIVGRTGAGKSSLALALFRGLEAGEGRIVIDGIDISTIGLQDLRESITIVPQDPTLFAGTIRTNLDPFGLFTDEDVFAALRRVRLIDTPSSVSRPSTSGGSGDPLSRINKNIFLDLSSQVTESGTNLSQGQRQLLCLARALLKEPRVILMDEATASIDYNTDAKIQETVHDLKSTTITIAHRLQTIIDYDKVLVLEKGEVKEFDHPWILLQDESSVFYGMCDMTGDLAALSETAKRAWKGPKLVDVDD